MNFHCTMANKHEALLALAMCMYQTKVICHIKLKQRRLRQLIIMWTPFWKPWVYVKRFYLPYDAMSIIGKRHIHQIEVNKVICTPVLWWYTYLKWLKKLITFLLYIPLQRKKDMSAATIVLKFCVVIEYFQFHSSSFLYVNTSVRKLCGITNLIHQNIFIWCGAAIKNKHLRLVICYISTSILPTCTS